MQIKLGITEIFYSVQGEGLLSGSPSVFIRFAGCPLRCKFCDTPYSLDASAGKKLSIPEIITEVEKYPAGKIVITGGEPLVNKHITLLCAQLKKADRKYHITIETNGIKFVDSLACDLMSISPKLSNAISKPKDAAKYFKKAQLQKLLRHYNYQLKFVIDKKSDIDEVLSVIAGLKAVDKSRVLLMCQSKTALQYMKKSKMVVELCKRYNFGFSPRLQLIFDEKKSY